MAGLKKYWWVLGLLGAGVVLALLLRSGENPGSPVAAVKAFTRAARAGDRDGVMRHLGPGTLAALEREARQATGLAGGHRVVTARELLEVGVGEPAYDPVGYREISNENGRATVEVRGPGGRLDVVKLVRKDGRWLIELR